MACEKSLPQHEKRKETYLLNVALISAFVRNTGCNVQRKFEQNKLCELDNFEVNLITKNRPASDKKP